MEKTLKILGVSGWGIPEDWYGHLIQNNFPNALVDSTYPSDPFDSEEAQYILKSSSYDLIIAYSLGSLWILTHKAFIPEKTRVTLLAPILAYPKESELGGKTSLTQLKYLSRAIKRKGSEPVLNEFYLDCRLSAPQITGNSPFCSTPLLQGLNFLETGVADLGKARDCLAIMGEKDVLLDFNIIRRLLPNLVVVPNAGHDPELLIQTLARELRLSSK